MNCRHCGANLKYTFLDLGFAPPSNAYLKSKDLNKPEIYYPLKIRVCVNCWLVQTEDFTNAEDLFTSEYAYFSSTSSSWLDHAKKYTKKIIEELNLDCTSQVIEIASNDGYLLKNFIEAGIPCFGVEPTKSTADAAEKQGIFVRREFFTEQLGKTIALEGQQADLIIGNNVFAHVPDINNFTRGLKAALKIGGTINLEFPHLMRLIEHTQFDTIYHEHFSYLSLFTVIRIFEKAGLRVWKVKELSTHGGSLRIYGCHVNDIRETDTSVSAILKEELKQGLQKLHTYLNFQSKANKIKNELLAFLIEQKNKGKKVLAYGAAAKGNTLLNYAGIKTDLLPFVIDASLSKQGKFMPGSHIPIFSPNKLSNESIDFLLILPWNLISEVKEQNKSLKHKGTRFVSAIPKLNIYD
jgi:SAM-dependent methyltransferase